LARVEPVDFLKESRTLLEYISSLTLDKPIMQQLPAHGGFGGAGAGSARLQGSAGPGVNPPAFPFINHLQGLARLGIPPSARTSSVLLLCLHLCKREDHPHKAEEQCSLCRLPSCELFTRGFVFSVLIKVSLQ
jgi:hypothetical protein